MAIFRDGLARLGWTEDRNLKIDLRFGGGDPDRIRALAAELVSLAPDLIVTGFGSLPATRAVQQQTQTIPIVFTGVGDPVTNGLVKSIARPEGNITGVTNLFNSMGGQWLELLKEAAPRIERVALINNGQLSSNDNYGGFDSIEEAARKLKVNAVRMPYRDGIDIVRGIDAFAADPNGALIVVPPVPTVANSEMIVRLAVQHRLPSIWPVIDLVVKGGLISYGSDPADLWRRAPFYVDRILRGAKVSELPVELPTKFQLVVNLKTAKAIGLTIPESFLLRADEVIE